MATRRRRRTTRRRRSASVGRPRRVAALTVNPRRRRRRSRRRNPTVIVARRRHSRRAAAAPRRRRHSRRRNPSAFKVGQILKDAIYGAGGAILTRTAASLVSGFVPGGIMSNPLANPALQAILAVTAIRWGGKKFLGQSQGDILMAGGLVSAGLAFADQYLPNIQGQLTGIVRAPVQIAPGVGQQAALADVYDVPGFGQLGDVYDVQNTPDFNQFPG